MDFRERLQRATERGERARSDREAAEAAEAMTEEESRRRHSAYRLKLVEFIDACLKQLADNFPGFRFESVMDESGWGGAVSRDDLAVERQRRRRDEFSRLKVVVGPFNQYQVLSIEAKGAVRNKESFTRSHYESIADVDEDKFEGLIELWVLDYAEQYAAS